MAREGDSIEGQLTDRSSAGYSDMRWARNDWRELQAFEGTESKWRAIENVEEFCAFQPVSPISP